MNIPVTLLRADLEFLLWAEPLWEERVFGEINTKHLITLCVLSIKRGLLQ